MPFNVELIVETYYGIDVTMSLGDVKIIIENVILNANIFNKD